MDKIAFFQQTGEKNIDVVFHLQTGWAEWKLFRNSNVAKIQNAMVGDT